MAVVGEIETVVTPLRRSDDNTSTLKFPCKRDGFLLVETQEGG